jgi:8-oxo-dGTP pyrophosphatase MutT (NUDIX family)
MADMANDPSAPAIPAVSATLMLLRQRDEIEVLMVQRNADAVFGSALVFPGGKLDAADKADDWHEHIRIAPDLDDEARGLRIAAWRELFEETGLLPDRQPVTGVHLRNVPYLNLIRRSGICLPLDTTHPFARWITPARAPRRFDTYFFLAAYEGGDDVLCDGSETVAAEWLSPRRAIALAERRERQLMFATRAQLHRLARCGSIAEAIADANAYPVVAIEPKPEQRGDRLFATIPHGLGYAYCEEDITGRRMTTSANAQR